jgi:tetratricopeptide (TPR) repeat protein
MRLETRIKMIAGVTLTLSLAASFALTPMVSAEAGRAQLGYGERAEESDPPEVALGIAMGAFRGLFVNLLWFRAQDLKSEGKFYDAIEMARAITKLQPRFPRVWAFHGWNLAYNISVASNSAEERWQWVNAGIKILRDEGIPKNPSATLLHKELAWIFIHKIQGITDDANQYYKRRLAEEWTHVMGPPPSRPQPNDEDVRVIYDEMRAELQATRAAGADILATEEEISAADEAEDVSLSDALHEASIRRRIAILEEIEAAPSTLPELYELEPKAEELVARLRDDAGVEIGYDLLRLVEIQRAIFMQRQAIGVGMQIPETERNLAFEGIFYDPQFANAGRELLLHTRKRVLIDKYKMELDRMIRYTRIYGPLDWRHGATQALYWARRGVEMGMRRRNTSDFDMINTDRVVMHAVQELYRWGDIHYNLLTDSYVALLDLDYVDAYTTALEQVDAAARARSEQQGFEDAEDPDRHFRLLGTGYMNFLRDVVRVYYRMGDFAKAQEYFQRLRTWGQIQLNAPISLEQELSLPLEEFVKIDFEERITSPEVAQSEITGAVQDALLRGLLGNDRRVFIGQMQYAADVHSHYMQVQNLNTNVGDARNRMQLFEPRFADAVASIVVSLFVSGMVGPDQAAIIWRRCPEGLREVAYDRLVEELGPQIGMEQMAIWFPEPEGMEEYRAIRGQLDANSEAMRQRMIQFEQQ